MKNKALIVGSSGQDGRLLFDLLNMAGYQIAGIDQEGMRCNFDCATGSLNILDRDAIAGFVAHFLPHEIYYLAAFHQSSQEAAPDTCALFAASLDVNVTGLVNVLEAVRRYSPSTRLFYTASSHIFKGSAVDVQDERTPIVPLCVYGITKAAGLFTSRYYRTEFSLFASVGIMYNHESSLRGENFVSRKIVTSAVRIKQGSQETLYLGDLNAAIDWGYAPDYVEAMKTVLALENADDFIIATGSAHTVREFAAEAFNYLNLDYLDHVREDPAIISRKQYRLLGDPSKIRAVTGWTPKTTFREMIRTMIDDEMVMRPRTATAA